jgi:predicted RNA binding protein YcfA (HicA-like mRNA interferase family)
MPTTWDNGIAARFMPKRYTSRELVKLAEEFGWMLVGVRGDHHNFKHPASRFIVTIVHPQKDVPVGRAVDTVKKIRLELK